MPPVPGNVKDVGMLSDMLLKPAVLGFDQMMLEVGSVVVAVVVVVVEEVVVAGTAARVNRSAHRSIIMTRPCGDELIAK